MLNSKNVSIRSEVFEQKFSCDLDKCKGACCTLESEYGAPLLEEEIYLIKDVLPLILDYLPEQNKNIIEEIDFFEKKDGELLTRSIDNKDCVFVYFDNGIAKCAIEKAYFDKKITYRKPVSCHLFPIRISRFGIDILRFEEFSGCEPAYKKGAEENISVWEFSKDALVRKYGLNWYSSINKK